jgi:uncharacterized protein YbbK (DUF523 family)
MISACLLGLPTRYDGSACPDARMIGLARIGPVIAICPEVMAGLPTPRPPAQIDRGDGADVLDGRARVRSANGEDVTAAFIKGAETVAEIARRCGVERAYLKDRSPSCGACHIKRGRRTAAGQGVCAALLQRMGLHIESI